MKKIEITYNIEDFENITNIMEFYDKINLTPMFGKEIKKVSQIKMNLENNEKLLSFFIKNRPKNKLKKNWDISVQLDWVNYSPVSVKDLDKNIIEVFLEE